MLGSRSIWHEGWKAVTTHPVIAGWGNYNDDTWELYNTDVDRAEVNDLAAEQPDKVQGARQHLVLGGRRQRRVPARRSLAGRDLRDAAAAAERTAGSYDYLPDAAPVPEWQAVNIKNRSFVIGALVDIPAPGAEGVLFAHGTRFGGHALYVKENRLHYVNNYVGADEQMIVGIRGRADRRQPASCRPRSRRRATTRAPAPGRSRSSTATRRSAKGRFKTQLGAFAIAGAGLYVGRHAGEPVTERLSRRTAVRVHRRNNPSGLCQRERRAVSRPRTSRRDAPQGAVRQHRGSRGALRQDAPTSRPRVAVRRLRIF